MTPKSSPKARRVALFAHELYTKGGEDADGPHDEVPSLCPPRALHAPSCAAIRLAPGLVVLRNAISADEQLWLARVATARGREPPPFGFWVNDAPTDSSSPAASPARRVPNSSPNAGRARVYDSMGSFAAATALTEMCGALVAMARAADDAMPSMHPTHCLLVHYSRGKNVFPKIMWHRDNAPNDGANDHPVVALSLGETADFEICDGWSLGKHRALDAAGAIHRVQLKSGDAILFGGPARLFHHCVQRIHSGTCPDALLPVLGDARVSFTFRDAPEVDATAYRFFQPVVPGGETARGAAKRARAA